MSFLVETEREENIIFVLPFSPLLSVPVVVVVLLMMFLFRIPDDLPTIVTLNASVFLSFFI